MRIFIKLLILCFLIKSSDSKAQLSFSRTDTLIVLHGTDTLDFAWTGGMNYCQFSTIDVDMDGKKDLFTFDRTNNMPLTFINQGGTGELKYKYNHYFEHKFPTNLTNWVLLRDFNCDGKEDIFAYTPGGIMVYRNISDTALKFELVINLLRGTQCTSFVNIYVSSVDIPSIEDMDYDGDLDILTFGVFGTFVEYHRNYSVELGYDCDSLKYTLKNQRWGWFREDPSICRIYLNQTYSNCAAMGSPELAPYDPHPVDVAEDVLNPDREGERHTGSTMLAIDINGKNAKDLLVTDISCKNVILLTNEGLAPNLDSKMISQDSIFPNYDLPVDIDLFPASFYVDVNNDGNRDLICAPNSTQQSDSHSGQWLYINTSTDSTPVFMHDQFGFLQSQMIERGEGSLPVFFDYNDDGLKDLVIANYGFYTTGGTYTPRFGLYKNIGTLSNPVFKLENNDYSSIFTAIGKLALYPTFGDLDNDGDEDMIVGDIDGNVHQFTNTAGPGNPSTFTLTTPLLTDITSTVIDVGKYATPLLVDIDRDGDLDLLIGEQNANINYYQNAGTVSAPAFKIINPNFGGVDVSESWTPIGYSVPTIYDDSGEYILLVGSQRGPIYVYDSIDGNLGGNFRLTDSLLYDQYRIGGRTGGTIADINSDNLPDLIAGNYRGGLNLYMGKDDSIITAVSSIENTIDFNVYPNPFNDVVQLHTNLKGGYQVLVYDASGRKIYTENCNRNDHEMNFSHLEQGVYFIAIKQGRSVAVKKLIK